VSSLAVSPYSFEVKVYADNAARALCSSAKNLLVTRQRERMSTTEITQVMALSACVSAFVSLVVLAAFQNAKRMAMLAAIRRATSLVTRHGA